MSKKANPAVVGSFVIGAIVISIVGIMILGGSSMFEKKFNCILYFNESISGLDIGAPVDFEGVRIGTVTDVWLEFERETGVIYRPVTLQIQSSYIRNSDKNRTEKETADVLESLVKERGMRAQLATQSMLTGKLKVELGFHPGTPIIKKDRDSEIWEMPTIPSPLAKLSEEVSELPLSEIIKETHEAIQRLSDLLDPAVAGQTFSNLNHTLGRMEAVLENVNEKIDPLGDRAIASMNSIQDIAHNISTVTDPNSPSRVELRGLSQDLREASKSVQRLANYLEEQPQSLLHGKK